MDNAPEGGKRITAHHCRVAKGVREIIILLPFLGECWLRTIPKPSLFLYVGKELWSFLSATYSQFRRICYPPAWSMRICYPPEQKGAMYQGRAIPPPLGKGYG